MRRDLQHVRLRLRRAEVDALREGGEVALARLRGRRQRRQLLRLGRCGADMGEITPNPNPIPNLIRNP